MKIYRIEIHPGKPNWVAEWHPTKADAVRAFRKIEKAMPDAGAMLDEVIIDSGRSGLCDFLNGHQNEEASRDKLLDLQDGEHKKKAESVGDSIPELDQYFQL